MDIAKWVRAARSHKGWTQTALGEKLSVTKGNVSGWENGHHEPGFNQVLKIAAETGYPIDPGPGDGWPFPGIERMRFEMLTIDQKTEIQGIVRQAISAFEAESKKSTGTHG